MDFESCNPAAQFAIQQSQNSFVIPNATPFIEFDLNVLATGHVGLTIRIVDVTQPLSFAVFNRVQGQNCPIGQPSTKKWFLGPEMHGPCHKSKEKLGEIRSLLVTLGGTLWVQDFFYLH